jgi:hypothetical protein
VWQNMKDAYAAYFKAATSGEYPKGENSHHMNPGEYEKFLKLVK